MENSLLILSIIVFLMLFIIVLNYVIKAFNRFSQIRDLTHEGKFLEYYDIYLRGELLDANALSLIMFEIFYLLGSSGNKYHLYRRIDEYIKEYNQKIFIIINIFPAVGLAATFMGFYLNLNNLSSDIFGTFEEISSIFLIGFCGIVLFGIGTVLFNYFQKEQDNLIVAFWHAFLKFEKEHLPPPHDPKEFYELINKSISEIIYKLDKTNENFLKLSENTEKFIKTIEDKNLLFDTTLTKINEKLEAFDNKVNNINNSIEKFNQNIQTFNNSVNELSNKTNSIKGGLETFGTLINSFNESIKQLIEKNSTIFDLITKVSDLFKLTNDSISKLEELVKTNEKISDSNQLIVNRLDEIVGKIRQIFELFDNIKPKIDLLIENIDKTIKSLEKLPWYDFSEYFQSVKKLLEEIKENINKIEVQIPPIIIEPAENLENVLKHLDQLARSSTSVEASINEVLKKLELITRSLNRMIIIKLPWFRRS